MNIGKSKEETGRRTAAHEDAGRPRRESQRERETLTSRPDHARDTPCSQMTERKVDGRNLPRALDRCRYVQTLDSCWRLRLPGLVPNPNTHIYIGPCAGCVRSDSFTGCLILRCVNEKLMATRGDGRVRPCESDGDDGVCNRSTSRANSDRFLLGDRV